MKKVATSLIGKLTVLELQCTLSWFIYSLAFKNGILMNALLGIGFNGKVILPGEHGSVVGIKNFS